MKVASAAFLGATDPSTVKELTEVYETQRTEAYKNTKILLQKYKVWKNDKKPTSQKEWSVAIHNATYNELMCDATTMSHGDKYRIALYQDLQISLQNQVSRKKILLQPFLMNQRSYC
jgi:hypothetical protein